MNSEIILLLNSSIVWPSVHIVLWCQDCHLL